jgi:iron complex transport system substrate-binding protein
MMKKCAKGFLASLGMNGMMSKEQILAVNPDFFLLPTWDYSGTTDLDQFAAEAASDPALQSVTAIRERRLVKVPDRYLVSSSQYIVDGVAGVAKAAYPQLFP